MDFLLRYNLKHNLSNLVFSFFKKSDSKAWVGNKRVILREGTTDGAVFKKIFIDQEYNFSFDHQINTIIDAGANIGLSAIYFSLKFPNARIIAIEPEKSNYDLLLKNIEGYPNILPLFGGINNVSGGYKIKNKNGDNWNFMLESKANGDAEDGRFYSIDDLILKFDLENIDFLKIDIEGGESFLFQDNLDWLKKLKSLSIELHDFILPGTSNNFFKAISAHEPFTFINYGENHLVTFLNH